MAESLDFPTLNPNSTGSFGGKGLSSLGTLLEGFRVEG